MMTPSRLLVKRNGEVWDDRVSPPLQLGLVQKVGNRWSATSSITHTEITNLRIRHDALWWLIDQWEGAVDGSA